MEQKTVGARLHSLLHLRFHHLSRSKAGDRPFLVIINLPAVADVPAFYFFQKERVYSVVHRKMCRELGGFRQVYHAHQRMQGFKSEELVVLVYCVQFYNFFHKVSFLVLHKCKE